MYQEPAHTALWSTVTSTIGDNAYFAFQTDYNLVVYDSSNSAKWSPNVYNGGGNLQNPPCDDTCFLVLQTDCNLVMYKGSSGTATAVGGPVFRHVTVKDDLDVVALADDMVKSLRF